VSFGVVDKWALTPPTATRGQALLRHTGAVQNEGAYFRNWPGGASCARFDLYAVFLGPRVPPANFRDVVPYIPDVALTVRTDWGLCTVGPAEWDIWRTRATYRLYPTTPGTALPTYQNALTWPTTMPAFVDGWAVRILPFVVDMDGVQFGVNLPMVWVALSGIWTVPAVGMQNTRTLGNQILRYGVLHLEQNHTHFFPRI